MRTGYYFESEHQLADGRTKPIDSRRLEKLVVQTSIKPKMEQVVAGGHDAPLDVSRIAALRMSERCKKTYKELIPPAMRKLGACQTRKRIKREPLTITAIAVAGVLGAGAAGGLGTARYSYWSSESGYNRLNNKDQLDNDQTLEITESKRKVSSLPLDLEAAQGVKNQIIKTLGDFGAQIPDNTAGVKHLAKYGSYLAWRGFSELTNIKADLAYLPGLTLSCRRNKVDAES